jgi:hypothetical protein
LRKALSLSLSRFPLANHFALGWRIVRAVSSGRKASRHLAIEERSQPASRIAPPRRAEPELKRGAGAPDSTGTARHRPSPSLTCQRRRMGSSSPATPAAQDSHSRNSSLSPRPLFAISSLTAATYARISCARRHACCRHEPPDLRPTVTLRCPAPLRTSRHVSVPAFARTG